MSAPAAVTVHCEQLVMTSAANNLERSPGFGVVCHSAGWPTELGSTFDDFGALARYLRQGSRQLEAAGHSKPLSLFWDTHGFAGDTARSEGTHTWSLLGCRRAMGRDSYGRPGNYVVHLLAAAGSTSFPSRVHAWDAPFAESFRPSWAGRRDLPPLLVEFSHNGATPAAQPFEGEPARWLVASALEAAAGGPRLAVITDSEQDRAMVLSWLARVAPHELDQVSLSTFERDLSGYPFQIVLLDRVYSALAGVSGTRLLDLAALRSGDLGAASSAGDQVATIDSRFRVHAEMLLQRTGARSAKEVAALAPETIEIPYVPTEHSDPARPVDQGLVRDWVRRVVGSPDMAASLGEWVISLAQASPAAVEVEGFAAQIVAAAVDGDLAQWRAAEQVVALVPGGVGRALLDAARAGLVDLSSVRGARVGSHLQQACHTLTRADFGFLAGSRRLYRSLVQRPAFARSALHTMHLGEGRWEFEQIARVQPGVATEWLDTHIRTGATPDAVLGFLFQVPVEVRQQVLRRLTGLPFGVIGQYLAKRSIPPREARSMINSLWLVRPDLLGVEMPLARYLTQTGQFQPIEPVTRTRKPTFSVDPPHGSPGTERTRPGNERTRPGTERLRRRPGRHML